MHHSRNQKINQINEHTLIIGIDIAKSFHYAIAIDERGRELSKSWLVAQSAQGFEKFYDKLIELMKIHGKTTVYVGFEPTGHYWMNLASFLKDRGIPTVLVNPMHVKKSKELDDNSQSKNDQKDARVIAKLIPQGNYSVQRTMSEDDHELRQGSAFRTRLQETITSVKNRIRRWMDLYFPEFEEVYKGLGVQACALLRLVPLPSDVRNTTYDKLVAELKTQGLKALRKDALSRLFEVAEHSIGLTYSPVMARNEIHALLDQYHMLEDQLEAITAELTEIARRLPEFKYLVSIPGISENTVMELIAQTGSLKLYDNPRQLIKHAGLTLATNSSGKYDGQKRISKRGRRRLRALLYKAVFPLIRNNQAFMKLYEYYRTRKENPLAGKEAIVVLCSKLLKIFHGLSQHQKDFDANRMMEDLPILAQPTAA